MGMSSSQARLLSLTARMHDIEYKAQRLEAQKLQLANDSSRVYEDYIRALDSTKVQYKSINRDGSVTFVDATLNALENGAVPAYSGVTSSKTFLLYDGANNKILVTPTFANAYGITGTSISEVGTLDEWLYAHGCTKAPVPDTYSATSGLTNVENIQSGSSYYTSSGSTPSISSTSPTTTPVSYTNLLKTTDPNKTYTVSSAEELTKLAQIINNGADTDGVKIVLTNNISVPSGWTSINQFDGSFNGNGYTISGLDSALFSMLGTGSSVSNLEISGASINKSGVTNVGILADDAEATTVSNVVISGSSISGKESVGGLIGNASNMTISNCSVSAVVTATDKDAGGLIGHGENINVSNCMASGTVTGLRRVGGLIGCVHGSTITQSKANCVTTATTAISSSDASDVGGFIGSTYGTTILHCESSGTVMANKNWSVGGFVGTTGGVTYANALTIDYCSANCSVTASGSNTAHGLFIGDGKGSIISNSNSYKNSDNFIGNAKNTGVQAEITNCYQSNGIASNEGAGSYTSASSAISGAGATSYTAPNLQHNATPASSTAVADIPLTNTNKGTLNVNGSDDKLCQYIAFKVGGANGYEAAYSSIKGGGYNTYQLAELVEIASSGSYSSISNLTSALTNKYNAANYNLNQTNTSTYNVTTATNPDVKQVDVSSISDITTRLAYDIWNKNGSGDINQIKSQISGAFSNIQLASLSYYYGKSEWTTIVNSLAGSISASSVSEYTNRYDSTWTINYASTNNVNVVTVSHPDEWVKDDNYYTQYNKYYELKALQGYNYEIIDEALCSQNNFVSNWLSEGGASLFVFGLNSDGSFNLVGQNVATDTSLQEVANEKDLKKAEAKY